MTTPAQHGAWRCVGSVLRLLLVLFHFSLSPCGADFGAGGASSSSSSVGASPSIAPPPRPANLSGCPSLRIGIINGVPYHYEVLAGLIHIFRPYARRTDVYINRYTRSGSGDGAWDILRRSRVNYLLVTRTVLTSLTRDRPFYDLLILVSPDYELDANQELLRHIRRRLTVAIVHNADFNETQRLISVAEGGGGAAAARLVTLSPHTAASLAAAAGRPVEWVLPTYPFKPHTNCLEATEVDLLGMCLRGFAIQGKFSNQRRNYSSIWSQMAARRPQLSEGYAKTLFHINLLGKGQEERLALPEDLAPFVTLNRRLPFRGFFDHLHHSFAIAPVLAGPRYLTDKFSSSLLSSLISGTPLIADARFLASYSMLDERSVYLQRDGEGEVDVMLRLVATPAPQLLEVRRAVLEARRRVNERATAFYGGLLRELCAASIADGGVAGAVGGAIHSGARVGGGGAGAGVVV